MKIVDPLGGHRKGSLQAISTKFRNMYHPSLKIRKKWNGFTTQTLGISENHFFVTKCFIVIFGQFA